MLEKAADKTTQAVHKAAEKTTEAVHKAADKAEETAHKSADKAEEAAHRSAEKAEDAADKTVEKLNEDRWFPITAALAAADQAAKCYAENKLAKGEERAITDKVVLRHVQNEGVCMSFWKMNLRLPVFWRERRRELCSDGMPLRL